MNSLTADSKAPLLLSTYKTCLLYKKLSADLDFFLVLNFQFESQRVQKHDCKRNRIFPANWKTVFYLKYLA